MKVNNKIRRITSVCAAAALVFMVSIFPITVSADTVDDFNISLDYYVQQHNPEYVSLRLTHDILNKDKYFVTDGPESNVPMDYATQLIFSASIVNSTNSVIIKAGETFDISISGIYLDVGVSNSGFIWKQLPDYMVLSFYHTDGSVSQISDFIYTYSDLTGTASVSASSSVSKDVNKIVLYQEIAQYAVTRMHGVYSVSIGMGAPDVPTYIQVEIQSKEAGLLGDMVNGTPQQNQQAQDAVGGLNNSADKLDDLGDQLASVEKPSFDNSNISADSLVPDTSLVLFASPFQALWENKQLLAMLTIVVTVVLISWVFFGKKA